MPHNRFDTRWGFAFPLAMLSVTAILASPAAATISASVLPYSPTSGWQSVYNGYATQENFEDTTLAPELSITLDGLAFATPETYTSLPGLYDPGSIYSDHENNQWDGTYAVTNYAYNSGLPAGAHWTNRWGNTAADLSQSITFHIGDGGASSFGVGMSDFQSLSSSSSPRTDHELFINGISYGTVESLGGAAFTPGQGPGGRNGYLQIVGSAATPIYSVEFVNLTLSDGLSFDALGYTAVPEAPAFLFLTVATIAAGVLGLRKRSSSHSASGTC
ncbi:MAG: hypothetical protein CMJ58_01980 [Planctomycetaceae bacterium]|nr:hypothetical protein [Planctomycetaceae bacterium]